MKIISKEKENLSRQIEVDLFRGFTAIIIIVCHVALYLGNNGDQALYEFGDIIGSEFGAPVFMSMMGISIVYSKHNDSKKLFTRGITLFLIGYLLNFVRSFVPYLVMKDANYFSTFESLFVVDILPFAGLSFMFIAFLKKIKVSSWLIVVIALVLAGFDQFLFSVISPLGNNTFLTCLLNLFVPIDEYSCFPFFTWFFFPAYGILLGEILARTKNKKALYIIYLILGIIAGCIIYGSMIYLYPNYQEYYAGNNFYYMGVLNLIVNGLLLCFGLGLWYFLSKILPKFIVKYLTFLSKGLNIFYIISWIIIGTILHILTYYEIKFETYFVIILMFIILVITSLLTKIIIDIKEKMILKKSHQNIEND